MLFLVAYVATNTQGQTATVNECQFTAKQAVDYFSKHEIEIDVHTCYNAKNTGVKTFELDELYSPLTRAAAKLVEPLGPVNWTITLEAIK